ncbi:MAG: prolyl-tRNA synthetase [Parcubacteria group bacterium SW_4_46_8]|nr:MAG: prolyl-tRNA synthetase [Parcubacteria group bacterium SW_4_46_8]
MTQHISSYTDLPQAVYQFQTKLRNELRAKSGIMRGREFVMKDLYSFSKSQEEHETFYEKMKTAYENIFDRVGLGDITYFTHAGAGAFSDNISHEFQTVCQVGEDIIFISDDEDMAINEEMMSEETLDAFHLKRDNLRKERAVEVGNIFPLGTKYSKPLGLTFKNENGEEKPVIMGSYGIGVGRLMGTVVEIMADEAGLVWPKALAPFDAHLLALGNGAVSDRADALYKTLTKKGIDVLYDDRSAGAGEKFADADLVGIPNRLVISENTIAEEKVEIKKRTENEEHLVTEAALLDRLS